jgi:phage portal protein BeeE
VTLTRVSPGPRAIVPVPQSEPRLGLIDRISKALSPRTSPANVPDVVTSMGNVTMVNQSTVLGRVSGASTYRAYAQTPWVYSAIGIRKDQVASAEWDIVPYDNTKRFPARVRDELRDLFDRPSATLDSFQIWATALIDDLLTLDAGVIEKVRYPDGRIAELSPVRGEWIAVDERWDGRDPNEPRYYFVPDGVVRARFRNSDMVYMMSNRRTNSAVGVSPMLVLQSVVESELQALEYNRRQVMGAAPDGVLNIGESAAPEDVVKAESKFAGDVFGQGAMAIIGGYKSPSWMPFRTSNRDMQFREWEDLLIRCIAIVLGLAPQDLGITFDVNRSTAETQSANTNDRGIRPLMSLFQAYMTREIVWDPAYGGKANNLAFRFKSLNLDETMTKAGINKIALGAVGWKSINEARETDGRAPIGDPADENNIFNHVLTNTPKGMLDLTAGIYIGEESLLKMQAEAKIDVAEAVAEATPKLPAADPPGVGVSPTEGEGE